MSWTKGPWEIEGESEVWTQGDIGTFVADCNMPGTTRKQAAANARLIAAAPELLEALKLARTQLLTYGYDLDRTVITQIETALAKAEGTDGGSDGR